MGQGSPHPCLGISEKQSKEMNSDTRTKAGTDSLADSWSFESASEASSYYNIGPLPEHLYDCYKKITDRQCRLIKKQLKRTRCYGYTRQTTMATILKQLMSDNNH